MAMVSRLIKRTIQTLRMEDTTNQVPVPPDHQHQNLLRKEGYVTKKVKNAVTVLVDDDQLVDFSLGNVEHTFTPEQFDQVVLFCVNDEDSNEIAEDDVRRIEPSSKKQISGKVTSVEAGNYGLIENRYLFYWKVLSEIDNDLNQNDGVTAECIECKKTDRNQYDWRCLSVQRINQPTGNVHNITENRDTKDKNGIQITGNVAVEFNAINETKELKMMVKNTSSYKFKVMESVFNCNRADSQLILVSPTRRAQFSLGPGAEKEYCFEATSKRFGRAAEAFEIKFFSTETGQFKITRFITVNVNDVDHQHATIGTGRNVQTNVDYTRSVMAANRSCISGPPTVSTPNFVATKFDSWPIPEILQNIALNIQSTRSTTFDALATSCPHLNNVLYADNYSRVFHDLLHLEEIAMVHSIRKYDKKSYFTRENEYLALAMENVGETRPSIIVGDYIIARDPWAKEEDNKLDQRGTIFEVKKNRILLKFHECFHEKYNNEDYLITFHFSRKSLRSQHHAIELAKKRLPSILFPDEIQEIREQLDVQLNVETGELRSENSIVPWVNPSLNIVQKQAVVNILKGVARPVPYVIFGPPGTGKTVTVIETILQIVKNLPKSRILVATPSNSAADLITERIISSGVLNKSDQFIRLVSHNNVTKDLVPQTILSRCGTIAIAIERTQEDGYRVSENGMQMNCNASRLKEYRVVIGTCMTVGKLMQCELPKDHFTHIVVDESGQSLETESIIPLTFVDVDVGQVILAGDPLQLGPVVLSQFAKKLGLARSLLVRLMERDLYKPDPQKFEHRYDHRIVTRLVNNYRSIPSLMNVYNDMFYDGTLKSMINDVDSEDVKVLKELTRVLPKNGVKKCPTNGVVFIAVNGKNTKCIESPSWCNIEEADSIVAFFNKLLKLGQKPQDIGIITPYTQQVKTIRTKLIRDDSETEVKIGTVEAFQGQERKVILLSTVRTMERDLRDDEKYSLGFIGHPNRLNVAISRARSLLVIFGCPKLLLLDENWEKLIVHCKQNESYVDTCPDSD